MAHDPVHELAYAKLAAACGVSVTAAAAAEDCGLIRQMRAYAADAFEKVGATRVPRGASVDLIFPGAAYFSVACGGFWDVLERHMAVNSSAGASGGACSSFMLLAGGCDMMLMGYLLYARSQGTSSLGRFWSGAVQAVRVTLFWQKLYQYVLSRSDAAWEAVRTKGYVAVASRPVRLGVLGEGSLLLRRSPEEYSAAGDNWIFHNFAQKEEAVRAYVATGEFTVSGLSSGVRVLQDVTGFACSNDQNSWTVPKTFCDGAAAAVRPSDHAIYAAYFKTFFATHQADVAFCTPASIARLYKAGVNVALSLLQSADGVGSLDGKPLAVLVDRRLPLDPQVSRVARPGDLQRGVFVGVERRRLTPASPTAKAAGDARDGADDTASDAKSAILAERVLGSPMPTEAEAYSGQTHGVINRKAYDEEDITHDFFRRVDNLGPEWPPPPPVLHVPFAEIDEVAMGGPASDAGIQRGDLLLSFGGVTAGNRDQMRALARLTERSEGGVISLLVLRTQAGREERVPLELCPRPWAGPGLLGCRVRPV